MKKSRFTKEQIIGFFEGSRSWAACDLLISYLAYLTSVTGTFARWIILLDVDL